MRVIKLMAVVVLLCGAASADAAELEFTWRLCADNGAVIEITEKDYKVVDDMPVYEGPYKDAVMADDEDGNHGLIYQGRFFWPCPDPEPALLPEHPHDPK